MQKIELRDRETGSRAWILPDRGFNCYRFQAQIGGELVEILDSLPEFETQGRPASSGIPILFPYPNRIRNGTFLWQERIYKHPISNGLNAIHGLVLDRPWRVTLTDERTVVGEFHLSLDAPELLELWPADFLIEVRYALRGNSLRADFRIVNPSPTPLPWGLGTHPYFRVPLSTESLIDDCLVQIPTRTKWILDEYLPTGERIETLDFSEGVELGKIRLDDVLTNLTPDPESGKIVMCLMDQRAGWQVIQTADSIFRECVVYTPPNRPSVCMEPYTCVTDAVNLHAQGIDTGWQILPPDGEIRTWIEIQVSPVYA